MASIKGNQKVAKVRSAKWRDNLRKGRIQSMMKPTKLRMIRIKAILSQEEIAAKVGIKLGTYGAIERGLRNINEARAEKIANILKANPKTIFKTNPKSPNKLLAF